MCPDITVVHRVGVLSLAHLVVLCLLCRLGSCRGVLRSSTATATPRRTRTHAFPAHVFVSFHAL